MSQLEQPYRPHSLNMGEVLIEAVEELTRPYPSISFPDWQLFQRMTGGFRPREFSILCGQTGAGKTTLLANLSAQLLRQNIKHFVMSVETGHTDFMKRVLSVLHGTDLNTGDAVNVELLQRITTENAKYLFSSCIEFSLYEDRVPIETLVADIRYMHDVLGCKVVFLDNLNFFLNVTRASEALIEMDRVVHELVILCKQIDVHIVMVMHPKKVDRDGESRVESLEDIRGSSLANQEAHNIFLFNRPSRADVKNGRNPYERELTIAKMRRRGQYVNKTLIFTNKGTQYIEKELV